MNAAQQGGNTSERARWSQVRHLSFTTISLLELIVRQHLSKNNYKCQLDVVVRYRTVDHRHSDSPPQMFGFPLRSDVPYRSVTSYWQQAVVAS